MAPLSPFRSWLDCITNTSGYDFRKGQADLSVESSRTCGEFLLRIRRNHASVGAGITDPSTLALSGQSDRIRLFPLLGNSTLHPVIKKNGPAGRQGHSNRAARTLLVTNLASAINDASRRRNDALADHAAVIAVVSVAVPPVTVAPAIVWITHANADATRPRAEIDLRTGRNRCGKG
jgi:hypothetical protein